MENKVLINLNVPELDSNFDIFIPVNEFVWKIKKLIIKSISDLSTISLDMDKDYILLNKNSDIIYKNNEIIINTNIRNGSELILISK